VVPGLLLAAVFAAVMSTVSTSLNSSATDYFLRFSKKPKSEARSMRILHSTTVVWGVFGTLLALAITRAQSELDA